MGSPHIAGLNPGKISERRFQKTSAGNHKKGLEPNGPSPPWEERGMARLYRSSYFIKTHRENCVSSREYALRNSEVRVLLNTMVKNNVHRSGVAGVIGSVHIGNALPSKSHVALAYEAQRTVAATVAPPRDDHQMSGQACRPAHNALLAQQHLLRCGKFR